MYVCMDMYIGQSMGGAIATLLAEKYPMYFQGVNILITLITLIALITLITLISLDNTGAGGRGRSDVETG